MLFISMGQLSLLLHPTCVTERIYSVAAQPSLTHGLFFTCKLIISFFGAKPDLGLRKNTECYNALFRLGAKMDCSGSTIPSIRTMQRQTCHEADHIVCPISQIGAVSYSYTSIRNTLNFRLRGHTDRDEHGTKRRSN